MNSLMDKLIQNFKEQRIVFARVLVNNEISPLTIEYEHAKMTVNHLEEDLPRFVRIWRYNRKVEASLDRIKWLGLEEDVSEELRIFLLLDPVFIIPYVDIEEKVELRPEGSYLINGSYNVRKVEFLSAITEYFKDEELRWIRLYAMNDRLFSMIQRDFPPYLDTVQLIFAYGFYC